MQEGKKVFIEVEYICENSGDYKVKLPYSDIFYWANKNQIHLFYDFDNDEYKDIVKEAIKLKEENEKFKMLCDAYQTLCKEKQNQLEEIKKENSLLKNTLVKNDVLFEDETEVFLEGKRLKELKAHFKEIKENENNFKRASIMIDSDKTVDLSEKEIDDDMRILRGK